MSAHLSTERKAHMLNVGTEVYSAYLLLDMVSSHYYVSQSDKFDLNHQKTSLNEFIISLIQQEITHADFDLGGQPCHITLTPIFDPQNDGDIHSWTVSIAGTQETSPTELKPINEHQPQDLLNFCKKYPLTISRDNTNAYQFSTELNINGKQLVLGGTEKLNLYQLHISNLYTILTRLTDENANLNMLVAMATGSGKSFTQALWFLVQYLTDNPCFFAAPSGQLVVQLKRDFERLLPANVTQHIPIFTTQASIATHEGSKWGIMSHEKLLRDHWDFLQDPRTLDSNMFLCIDEEHLASHEELFSKRIAILADHYPTMFLSATPSEESYQLSGNQPVASLSRKEKETLGISKAAVTKQASSQGSIAKSRQQTSLSPLQSMIMSFVSAIEDERLSTAHEYADQSETTVTYKSSTDAFFAPADAENLRRFIRWNIASPIGEKALILVDAHDAVINLGLLRNGNDKNAYKNGNRVLRDNVYDFFQLGDNLDTLCFENHRKGKKEFRQALFLKALKEHFPKLNDRQLQRVINDNVDFDNTQKYMENRVLHGLIENTLTYLLGYDSNHLDYLRFHHLDKLTAEVTQKLNALPRDARGQLNSDAIRLTMTQQLMQEGLPEQLAAETAAAMYRVIAKLDGPHNKSLIIDNWVLDKQLHALFSENYHSYYDQQDSIIIDYLRKHKAIFMVNGLEKTATPIQSNQPFFSLAEESHRMDSELVKNNNALKHQLSPLEALDDTTKQTVYKPNYCPHEYTHAVVDTLFRKGLVGAYITSEKVTGFNDPHLHHVSMIIDSENDPINTPDQIIQGAGRNRGLNPARQPHFILTGEKGIAPSFSPDNLEKKNYYPDFFKAKKQHHQSVVKRLGQKMALAIRTYVEANQLPDGSIPTDKLNKKLNNIIINEFEKVYRHQNFNFKKTRKIFKKVLANLYQSLYAESKALNRSYVMPRSGKIIAGLLNILTTIYYKLSTLRSYFSFVRTARHLKKDIKNKKASSSDATYAHIVRHFNFKKHISKGIPAKRFRDILKDEINKSITHLLAPHNLHNYLKPEIQKHLVDFFKYKMSAHFICLVGTLDEQLELLRLIESKNDWLEKAFQHSVALTADGPEARNVYFEILKTDPEIAAYFADHGLTVEEDRPMTAFNAVNNMKNNVISMINSDNPLSPDFLPQLSRMIINNLDGIQFIFHPKDANFLRQHKNEIAISIPALMALADSLQQTSEEIPAEELINFLRACLPPETLQAADEQQCLVPELYNSDLIDEEMESLVTKGSHIDMNLLRDHLADNLDHYIKSPIFYNTVNYLLGSFSADHLETLLNALYPEDNSNPPEPFAENPNEESNKIKVQLLLDFKKDLKKLSSKEIFAKYASMTDASELDDFENTPLGNIFAWLYDIYEEILDCTAYWDSMDDKGVMNDFPKEPKLCVNSPDETHPIWNIRTPYNEASFPTIVAKKTLFLKGTQNAFNKLNEVESLKNKNTVKILDDIAQFFTKPLRKAVSGSRPSANKKSTPHQLGLFASATTLGAKMHAVQPLSEAEIRSSATQDRNAVKAMRRELRGN